MRFSNDDGEDEEDLQKEMKKDYVTNLHNKFGDKTDMLINLALVLQATAENMAVIFNLSKAEKLAVIGIVKTMMAENHINQSIDEIDDLLG